MCVGGWVVGWVGGGGGGVIVPKLIKPLCY